MISNSKEGAQGNCNGPSPVLRLNKSFAPESFSSKCFRVYPILTRRLSGIILAGREYIKYEQDFLTTSETK